MNHDICLQIEGSLLERLIKRAMMQGAHIAQLRRTGPRSMRICTDLRSAEMLMALCKKYGYDCRILRRGGRTAMLDVLRARWTVGLGLLLCGIICALVLSRIWMVDVAFTGPSSQLGNERAILSALDAAGVHTGMSADALEVELLQTQLMAEAGDYSFIGVRRQGIRLLVEASPEVPAPQVYAIGHARDLVAARDGIVQAITVHSGEACVQIGDTVRRGQTLIRGEEAKSADETAPVGALGEVIARSWVEGHAEGAHTKMVQRRTGASEASCKLQFLGFSLPLLECEGFASEEQEIEILPIVGLFLPLEMERTVHHETQAAMEKMDANQLESQLIALAQADVQRKIAEMGVEIAESTDWVEITQTDNTLRARAVYEISTDIATTRDALN